MSLPSPPRPRGPSPLPLGLSLLLTFLSGCATPPPPPAAKRSIPYKGVQKVYPSGLRLVAHELPDTSRMALTISIGVGAADDPEDKPGLAELASILTSSSRPGGPTAPSLTEQLAKLGAAPQPGLATYDGTSFGSVAPVARFSELAALGARWLQDPLANLSEEDFLRTRELVTSLLRKNQQTLLTPEIQVAEVQLVNETVLPGHPYGRPAFGTPESLERLTWKDVRAFVELHYKPERAVVTTLGPMPLEDVTFLVARSFQQLTHTGRAEQTLPWRRAPPAQPVEPLQALSPVRKPGPAKHPHLWLVWTVPGRATGNRIQAVNGLSMLAGAISAQLQKAESPRLVRTRFLERDGLSLLMTMVELKDESEAPVIADQALTAISSLPSIARHPQLKNLQRGLLSYGYSADLAKLPTDDVAHVLRATGRWDYLRVHQEQLEEALLDDNMSKYMDRYLARGRVRMVLVVPET